MPVLLVLSMSLSNDNGSKTAKGTFFLISSATFNGSLSVKDIERESACATDLALQPTRYKTEH
jgi:hypothetical protein